MSSRSRAPVARSRSSSWPASARRDRASTSPASAASQQFVGREAELRLLEEALGRARGGEATAVGVVAEPGIGKSRLYHEFAQRCRAEGLEVFEAQAQAHGRSIPFMPILQMLRSFYGIADQDSEQTAREKIAGRSLLLDPGFAADLPLVFDFLGVPDPERPVPKMNPEGRGRALGDFLCRLVSNPARQQDAGPDRRGPALDR